MARPAAAGPSTALDAALPLLVARGVPSFTLAEVAHTAHVSTGSIYGRVDRKDDLIRALRAREMARLDAETRGLFAALHAGHGHARGQQPLGTRRR